MKRSNGLPANLRVKLLRAVVEFISLSGLTEREMRETFDKVVCGLRSRQTAAGRELGEHQIGSLNLSAELLRLWHRDHRYIDQNANPRPLYLAKGRNSLSAAIKRLDATANATAILQGMKSVGLIRRTSRGRYLPTAQSAIFGELHPIAIEHVAKTVIHLVSTVHRNTDPTGRSLPLIERHAYIPDLDPNERQAFADFTRIHGMAYLESVDDWLQQRRLRRAPASRRNKQAGVAASVHLVAYLGDETRSAPRTPALRIARTPRIRSLPEARA